MSPAESLTTPVVLAVFNRPTATERVFEAIRQARPATLLVVADGPRPGHPTDAERCARVRAIVERVDWPCQVLKDQADANMGCGRRLVSGLTWAFEQVEEAIVLEDDCLPHPTFFPFCQAVLAHYRDDRRVMHVNGNNYGIAQGDIHPYSYGFCRHAQVWGWASWRRAWRHYDQRLGQWPAFRDGGMLEGRHSSRRLARRQSRRWDQVHQGRVDTWDFQWHFAVMSQNGLAVSPTLNLVSNIGFSAEATHTRDTASDKANLTGRAMDFPLRHPPMVCHHPAIDAIYEQAMLGGSRFRDLLSRAGRLIPGRT